MSDNVNPTPNPASASPKKETVRISLPQKPASVPGAIPPVKRETVRINIPPKATVPPVSAAPIAPPRPPAAPSAPVIPKPPVPAAPVAPVAPKPPAPSISAAPVTPAPAVAPVTAKATSLKKETARIQLPPEPKELPKATVKMDKTRPLAPAPSAAVTSAVSHAPVEVVASDSSSTVFAVAAAVIALLAFGVQLWTFLS